MSTNEIDIISLVNKVLKAKKTLFICLSVSFILGIGYALGQQKRYTSSVVIAPEANSMGMSQSLSDIAGAIGMDLGSKSQGVDAIYPDIYPDIFASNDFIVKLFPIPVIVNGQKKTYYDHIIYDAKIPFYAYPFAKIGELFAEKDTTANTKKKEVNPFQLTKQQNNVCQAIRNSIDCQIDKGNSVIHISVADTNPYVAACIADTLQKRLQEYITLYRTQKARQDLAYAQKINADAKKTYEKARQQYAAFSDANTDVTLMSYHSKIEDLENDMQLKYNNYSSTQQQVQQAHDKIKENTPAFTIIESASVPLQASSTPRSVLVIMFMIVGIFVDIAWVLVIKDTIKKLKLS